jgi:hypothetical protein
VDIAHYVHYLKKAVERWEKKELMGWPGDQDEIEAFKLNRARGE